MRCWRRGIVLVGLGYWGMDMILVLIVESWYKFLIILLVLVLMFLVCDEWVLVGLEFFVWFLVLVISVVVG